MTYAFPRIPGRRLSGLGEDSVDLTFPAATGPDLNALYNAAASQAIGPDITYTSPTAGNVGSGLTATQIAQIIAAGGSAATNIYKSTQSPYLVPGTNIIANPGSTPLGSAFGTTATQVGSSLTSMIPLLLVVVVAASMLKK